MRDESLPAAYASWLAGGDGRRKVYVALGTFLSLRSDVLVVIADALRRGGLRAAVATGDTPIDALGPVPDDWIVDRRLPQVAMLSGADLAIHHGGNNSVQECLAAGVRQLVLPFSTDQFANAADLARTGRAAVASPNHLDAGCLARQLAELLSTPAPAPVPRLTTDELVNALFA